MKTAVVLVNLGGPENLDDVQPFLYNLFSDPDIIQFPFGKRGQDFFAKFISKRRAPYSARLYEEIGGGSPIHSNTVQQAKVLEEALETDGSFSVFVAQRYWHPFISETIQKIRGGGFEKIVLLPLFPQFSTTTTLSVINEWVREGADLPKPDIVQRFHLHPKYIEACRERLREKLKQFDKNPHILFSAHSIPKSRIKKGDPYEREIEETTALIMEEIHGYGHSICYQSRVGPVKWLGPNISTELRELNRRGIYHTLVFPAAFVSEHLETLNELDIKYKKLADELGFKQYLRADTVQDHPLFIACLRDLVLENCN